MPLNVQQVYRYDRLNQEVVLVSIASSGVAGGNGESDSPTISADGTRVAFKSQASNLDSLDQDNYPDIYVRELDATPITSLASVNADGTVKGTGYCSSPAISANGTRVVFVTDAKLDPLDDDSSYDIYVRELGITPTTFLASVNADGTVKGNGYSGLPTISADGTRVAFVSAATNLDPLDADQWSDVYVRELDDTPTTFLVSVNADGTVKGNGTSEAPAISASGTRVVFASHASNLHPLDKDWNYDIYVRELDATPTTFLASVNADGTVKANGSSYFPWPYYPTGPSISADGMRVAFVSDATNLDPLDSDSLRDIYVRELDASPTTFLASINAEGNVKGNGSSENPVISADGTHLAFLSTATNLDPRDSDTLLDVYVRELDATPTTYLVSIDSGGVKANGKSDPPSISLDGSHIAFVNAGSNLVANDFNLSPDLMIRSLDGATTDLASRADPVLPSSTSSPGAVFNPGPATPGHSSMDPGQHMQSADGRYVVFVSVAPNLVAGVTLVPGVQQVYRYDVVNHEMSLVSVAANGTTGGNGTSDSPTISADGTRVAFRSLASNLDPLDGDTISDVYLRELDATPNTFLASVNAAGTVKGNGSSSSPIISANGVRVAFASSASNLDPLDSDTNSDIYVRELDAISTTFLVSVNSDGTVKGDGGSNSPTISADGTRVAFGSSARNLDPLDKDFFTDIYVRELDATPTTILASVSADGTVKGDFYSFNPTISANGKRVAFSSKATNLDATDRDPNEDVYVRVLDDIPTTIRASGSGRFYHDSHSFTISADGMRVAFATENSLVPMDGYPERDTDVYVRELDGTGRIILVSVNPTGTAKGNQGGASPRISADGRRVVFVSQSNNLDPLDGDTLYDVYVRELDASPTTYLVSKNADGAVKGNEHSSSAVISADGTRVAFVSLASNLVANDFNGQSDVFVRELPPIPAAVSIANSGDGKEAAAPTNGKFKVELSIPSPTPTVVAYTVSAASTATPGIGVNDYESLAGTVTIPANALFANIDVLVHDDLTVEATETVVVKLTSIDNVNYIVDAAADEATVDITDEDTATVSIAATGSAAEPAGIGKFTVTQTNSSSSDTMLSYVVQPTSTAAAGLDYVFLSGTVKILAGFTTAEIEVTPLDDSYVEGTETIIVTLTGITSGDPDINPPIANRTARLNLLDDDVRYDFGDAPNSYGTLLASNGARHFLGSNLFLGAAVDAETDGQLDAAAQGDDSHGTDEEDGVALPPSLQAGVNASATVTASAAGFLNAWIDFNRNGTFDMAEQIAASLPVTAGSNVVSFPVPLAARGGGTFARFRLSSVGGLSSVGAAPDGEVEDYAVSLVAAMPGSATLVSQAGTGQNVLLVMGTAVNDVLVIEPRPRNLVQIRVQNTCKLLGIVPSSLVSRIVVYGLGGNDIIIVNPYLSKRAELHGGSGNDQLFGGGGSDVLYGDEGNDLLYGIGGNDQLFGGDGIDSLNGGNGDDILEGQGGNDFLNGGLGNDIYRFGTGLLGNDTLNEYANQGNDTLVFSKFQRGIGLNLSQVLALRNPLLQLVLNNPVAVENAIGTAFNDRILGNVANNILWGGNGDDQLTGSAGIDYLYGEAGNDSLSGDAVDLLYGGTGQDLFDGIMEKGNSSSNPKPKKYKDWGLL